jgi:glycine/D-amino acid oxidase-like deaminating enzyme
MNSERVKGISYWTESIQIAERPVLSGNLRADVCVIGAGIAGLTTAYLLAKEGRFVVVLEARSIGSGMTGFTTAHLSCALDDRYYDLERRIGLEGTRLAADSHASAIDCIERIVNEEQIRCDFCRCDGYLFAPPGDTSTELDDELKAVHRAGLTDVVRTANAPIRDFDTGAALRFPNQAQFHPIRYLEGLASAIERLGGKLFCNTRATRVAGGEDARVETPNGAIECSAIVVATNVPINDRLVIHTKQAPYTTYVIGAEVSTGAVTPALYWDTRQSEDDHRHTSYHYARLVHSTCEEVAAKDILIVGGEDHKSGQADDGQARFDRLESWTRERWPIERVAFRWSGQVMEPNDGMAFIGPNPLDKPNVYAVTGDSGNGMTHGTIGGLLLSDLIQGRSNIWSKLYDPGRISRKATIDFIKENDNVAAQYAKGYLRAGEVSALEAIPPGQGAVVSRGISKLAVFRDKNGMLHECSAVCPHLGCVVAWNSVESTWDCPCHDAA